MKIKVCSIDKRAKKELYTSLIEHFIKLSKPYAQLEVIDIFNNAIAKAQDRSSKAAQIEYTKAFEEHLNKGGYTIALDPNAKEIDSIGFSKLLQKQAKVTFFIGGAYGLDLNFKNRCNISVSFGKITMSHKLTKVVLIEQIYRALTIINNHPYHK